MSASRSDLLVVATIPNRDGGVHFVALSGDALRYVRGLMTPNLSVVRERRDVKEFDPSKAPLWLSEVIRTLVGFKQKSTDVPDLKLLAADDSNLTREIRGQQVKFFLWTGRVLGLIGCLPCDLRDKIGAPQPGTPVTLEEFEAEIAESLVELAESHGEIEQSVAQAVGLAAA